MVTELLGWVSSLVLLLTISKQIHKQWREASSTGVSKWLFIGQATASLGFTLYSWLLKNWVFVVTNMLLLLSALIGLSILLHQRRHAAPTDAHANSPTPKDEPNTGNAVRIYTRPTAS